MKLSFALAIPGLAALIAGPALAQIQVVTPENTPELCTDGVDNDGDGYTDCADQDCQRFPQCAPQAPPPQAQPVQPQAYPQQAYPQQAYPQPAYPQYQPAPYQPYMPPPVSESAPPFGLVTGIIGSTLLLTGFGMLMGSIDPWLAAGCTAGDPVQGTLGNCDHTGPQTTAIVLDAVGGVFFAVGIIMTPIGWYQFSKYRQWKKSHHAAIEPHGLGFSF